MDYENCLFVAGLRSIQCIIIKRVLVCARDELCKNINLHTFKKNDRASIPSVNVMVWCICWMPCLLIRFYVNIWNVVWQCLKYGLSSWYVFYTFSLVFGWFSYAGQQKTCCGSRTNSTFAFLPRSFLCRMNMA